MSDRVAGGRTLVTVRQRPASADTVAAQLLEHFRAAREALLGGAAVRVEVSGGDLLGQGAVADAAVASGLLGLARALAIEGATRGWSINVLACGEDPSATEAATHAAHPSGQLDHVDLRHLGRLRS